MNKPVKNDGGRPPISAAEKQLRREAVDYARASVWLSGFVLDDEYHKESERFVRGEIDSGELTAFALKRARDIGNSGTNHD